MSADDEESAVAILATTDVEKAAENIAADAGQHSNVAIPVQPVTHAEGDQEEAEAIEMDEDGKAEKNGANAGGEDAAADKPAAAANAAEQEEAEEVQEVADAMDVDQEVTATEAVNPEPPSAQRKSKTPTPAAREPSASPRATRAASASAKSTEVQQSPARQTRGGSKASSSASVVVTGVNGSQANGNGKSKKATQDEPIEIDEEDGGEDDEQYEIEAILGHQKYGRSGHRYLVSWVGYGAEHNCWVVEEDFASKELIDEYWQKERETSAKKTDRSSRKRKASEAASPAPASQRPSRGRRSQAAQTGTEEPEGSENADAAADESVADGQDGEDDKDDQVKRPISRHAETHTDSVEPYMNIANWEDQVQEITTVERKTTKKLLMYMVMVGGERVAVDEDVVYARCPQKMLRFYARHLKWSPVIKEQQVTIGLTKTGVPEKRLDQTRSLR